MTKLEKVINALECHRKRSVCVNDEGKVCPYFSNEDCYLKLTDDALELLKAREAQPAIIEGSDVIHIGRCPSCKTVLQPLGANYCHKCGQAVKWDD